ncbi:MAG: beta-N-acetylhexosaminidase NagZ [Rhodobacteraceae bacterium HLUCCA08]|nr:MAG: beta-N-acetylhexosaminidase NagZ [Rhodobacteraceae bacterium HLUCCA08]
MASGAAIFGPEGRAVTDWEKGFFREYDPLGFILFARNVDSPEQLRRLTGDLRDAVGRDAPILIDQEGGRVQRMRAPHWRDWLPPLDEVARSPDPARAMYLRYRLIAAELRAVGIDANCAPCADVASRNTHAFLRNRCYGTDPALVARIGRAVADALLAGGVLPVLKHMPGHGRAWADSHVDLPKVRAGYDRLSAQDFAPFEELNDLPMGMTAHIVYTALGQDGPATQSPEMIRLIREELGFAGLLMSDDIGMEALSGSPATRAAATIAAGCDVVLQCNGNAIDMAQVAAAAGALRPEAAARVEAALAARRPPDAIDIPALEAEFEALQGR